MKVSTDWSQSNKAEKGTLPLRFIVAIFLVATGMVTVPGR